MFKCILRPLTELSCMYVISDIELFVYFADGFLNFDSVFGNFMECSWFFLMSRSLYLYFNE